MAADCERARALASQAVDCELSELERHWLTAHLAECPACETFLVAMRDVTLELRAAPLPTPSRPLVLRIGRRPPLYIAVLAVIVAVLAVIVAVLGGGAAGTLASAPAPLRTHVLSAVEHLPGARLPLRIPV